MVTFSVRHILQLKGNDLWCISPDASVYDALRMMSDKDVGALVVLENEKMVGICRSATTRKVILLGKSSKDTKVHEIMSTNVVTIHPEQTVEEAMELMNSKHIRHLPVVEDESGGVMGIISLRDVVRTVIHKQREAIKNLESKITS